MNTIKMKYKYSILFVLLLIASIVKGQVPAGYYDDAIGKTGDELKAALHQIIDDHVEYSYSDLRDFILLESDEDPDNSNNVILLYSGFSRGKDEFGGSNGQWNREHVWAKSHGGFDNVPPEGTDAHHIRPSDVMINNVRGNLDFDNGGSPVNGAPGCKKDDNSFEPHDDFKGDVARMIFYMAVRYEGGNGELDLEVVDMVNTTPNPEHGKLSTLMDWHAMDPPDDFEENRNEVVFDYQENRNPFIDYPEFVEDIWGDPAGLDDRSKNSLICFPNPFADKTYVNCDKEAINFSVLSMDGRMIIEGSSRQGKTLIDLSNYNSGIYLLLVSDATGNISGRFKLIKTGK